MVRVAIRRREQWAGQEGLKTQKEIKKEQQEMTGLMIAALSFMGAGGPGFAGLLNPAVQEEIGLTDDQIEKITNIITDHQLAMIDLRADLGKKRLELNELLAADKPDMGKIEKVVKEMGELRTQMMLARIRTQVAVNEVLSAEQREKHQQLKATRAKGGKGKGQGKGKGKPGF